MTDANKITALMADGRWRTSGDVAIRLGMTKNRAAGILGQLSFIESESHWGGKTYRMKPAAAAAIKEGTV